MPFRLPSPGQVFIAILILTVLSWQLQVGLVVIGLLFVLFSHWIVGGLFLAVAGVAWLISREFHF
jgi:hypothetical protein